MKRRLTIRSKLTLAVTLIVLGAFSICALTSCYYFQKNKKQDAQKYLDTVTYSIRSTLVSMEEDLKQFTTMPYYFGMVDILRKYAGPNDTYVLSEDISEISNQLAYISDMKSSIINAYVAMENGRLFAIHFQNATEKWSLEQMPWLADCKTNGSLTMVPWHDASYVRNTPTYAVSFVRTIKDIWTMENLGWLIIDLDAEEFRMCVPEKTAYGETFYIFNDEGELVFPYPDENTAAITPQTLKAIERKGYIYSKETIPQMNLTIIGILETNQYENGTFTLMRTLLVVFVIMLAFSVALVYIMTHSLHKPLRRLHLAMRQLIESNFSSPHIHINSRDEIADLADGFNHMVDEIQNLLQKIQENNIKERKILFALLQGQMSPHFIYNSLETMGSMAMLTQNYALADGITALGRLMRHLTDNGDQETYLEEELRFMEDYIYLQTLTTSLQVDFQQDIDFSHAYLLVPKFILQPLVENVYRYAGKGKEIELSITSQIKDDHLLLTVYNNGNGTSPERLEQIRKRIYTHDITEDKVRNRNHGFALRNIYQRIQLLYGEEYGLAVACKQNIGFEIVIDLPVIWEREAIDENSNC